MLLFYPVQKISDDVTGIQIKWSHLNVFTWVIYRISLRSYFHCGKNKKRNIPSAFKPKTMKISRRCGIKRHCCFPLVNRRGRKTQGFNSASGVMVTVPTDTEAG